MNRILLTCVACCFSLLSLIAQTEHPFTGAWDGQLALPGRVLKMQLSITGEAPPLKLEVDVPAQGISGMEGAEVSVRNDSLSFKLPGVPGNAGWSGVFKAAPDGEALDSLTGNWSQGGRSMVLNFARPSGPLAGEALAENLEKIEIYASALLERMNVPGAGIAIVHGDEVVKSFGVGYADIEAKRAATGNTVFAIGSSSKAFTAFGNALLVDEGKLEWDKPIREYMPDFRMFDDFATEEMTAIDLLTHQSGLPRHDLMWYFNDGLTREDIYQRLRYLEPTESFRSAWQYQNLMYMTAGLLTEKISGMEWEDHTRKKIFEPLGMSSANFDITTFPNLPDAAVGYVEREEGELKVMDYHPLPAIGPAGSINASAADMGKWVSLHLNGGKVGDKQLITASSLRDLHRSRMYVGSNGGAGVSHTGYALGWFTYDWNGNYIIEHGGNIDGFSALVYMAPKENIGFVILTNKNGTDYGSFVARYALDILTGKESTDYYTADEDEGDEDEEEEDAEEDEADDQESPFANTEPQRKNDAYAGTYLDPGYGEVTISEVKGKLRLQYGTLDAELKHRHFETFRAKLETVGQEIEVNFIAGANGKVRSLEIAAEPTLGHPIIFEKQGDASMKSPEYLDQLVGKYNLDGQILTIKRVRDYITLDVPGQPTYDLEADADNEFKLTIASGYSVEFHFKKGEVVALELHQPNGNFRAERE